MAPAKKQTAEVRRWTGSRIRRRRLFLKMTQKALAHVLGITFQQVQKYEKGANGVPGERLIEISRYLQVTPDYFAPESGSARADALEQFIQSPEGLAVCRAMACLSDAQTRATMVLAVEVFCDSHLEPENAEAAALASWLRQVAGHGGTLKHHDEVAAAIHAAKIEVAQLIGNTLKARKLTQKFAARILRTDQSRISALARGNVKATSLEKLLRYLMLLGWDAGITIAKRPADRQGKIGITRSGT